MIAALVLWIYDGRDECTENYYQDLTVPSVPRLGFRVHLMHFFGAHGWLIPLNESAASPLSLLPAGTVKRMRNSHNGAMVVRTIRMGDSLSVCSGVGSRRPHHRIY